MPDDERVVWDGCWSSWKSGVRTVKEWRTFISTAARILGRPALRPTLPSLALRQHYEGRRRAGIKLLQQSAHLEWLDGKLVLYRGISNEPAVVARALLSTKGAFPLPIHEPQSYSLSAMVAQRFAEKGSVPGLVFRIAVSMDDIVYTEDPGVDAHGLQAEAEVAAWPAPLRLVSSEDVTSAEVPVRTAAKSLSNKFAKDADAHLATALGELCQWMTGD